MAWSLSSTNPKGTLLLALGLMGGIATTVEGDMSSTVLVNKVGSGYASKYSGLISQNNDVSTVFDGKKQVNNHYSKEVSVSKDIKSKKRVKDNFFKETYNYSQFNFKRPNYYKSGFNEAVVVHGSINTLVRKLGSAFSSIIEFSEYFGNKIANNHLNNSALVGSNIDGIKRFKRSFLSEIIVSGTFVTVGDLVYADTSCISVYVTLPRNISVIVNKHCNCKILLGQSVTLGCTITDADGALIDPENLVLTIVRPSNQRDDVEMVELVKDSVGEYHFSFVPDSIGTYLVSWKSSDDYYGVGETTFHVNKGLV